MKTRIEKDSFGEIAVPADRLWGAQTQRSLHFFSISNERMPDELIMALASVKRACAAANRHLGLLSADKAAAIMQAADEVLAGQLPGEFPLSVWQTGSGTQTNMNMNEVLANRASELLGGKRGSACLLHPNDEINLGQSSNDIFPTAMHVAITKAMVQRLLPALTQLKSTLEKKSRQFAGVVKIGRTHLQDATPITLGQEISAYVAQLGFAEKAVQNALPGLLELAVGGTAVGTGLNTHAEFGVLVAQELSRHGDFPDVVFVSAANKFAALAGHEALAISHAALKVLAGALIKIANDLRWLASGPRCGLGEISMPANEPGSSIMPGKVNPTQAEALLMLCHQVFANDLAISLGAASGNFELNVSKPLIAHAHLQSLRLLSDGMRSFDQHCAQGISANTARIEQLLEQSLMLVTALVPHIGYDKCAHIAREAHASGGTLKDTAVALGYVTAKEFTRWVQVKAMT
ncbi:MAG: class II fumarate hydratase [Burkholderiaceae bacterium]